MISKDLNDFRKHSDTLASDVQPREYYPVYN